MSAIDIPDNEVSCGDMMFYLHVPPVRMESLAAASDLCDKMEENSITLRINSEYSFFEFHKIIRSSPAYCDRCWHGSRMITWIPYVKKAGKLKYQHLKDGTNLKVIFASWNNIG